ncbi:uncharacterized protein A4U43_C05F16290 [Asparagus officinalis]|uniref:RING-type E3 ubiquitin transferase n=1 Tax=Asparagus officinalis TaxID=4686 RepID=A0A5P1ET20_ASPOF|nr:probable E3 ubiquitin-protein ligase RHB1A isoform X2 [Asparagus officinalis]ONK68813.1 uncharacterized protein A4U43_C05F16290 [Asparagus officinalis]
MGSSCSRPAQNSPTRIQTSPSNQVRFNSQQAQREHVVVRSNRINPITIQKPSHEEVANDANTDQKTEPLHSKDNEGEIPLKSCTREAQSLDEGPEKSAENQTFFDVEDEDEDVCPICLEEYSKENPRLVTECKHDYHFGCMLEWMDRSCTCPICSAETLLDACKICSE